MGNLLAQLKKTNHDLREEQIVGLLYILREFPDISVAELIQKTGLPQNTIKRFRSVFYELVEKNPLILQQMFLHPYLWSLLNYRDESLASRLGEIRKEHKLVPKREYDQFFATYETSVAKVRILKNKGVLANKRIALLGDDDLVSVCTTFFPEVPSRVTVFDIDQGLLDTLQTISDELNAPYTKYIKYDVRNEVPARELGAYDVVVTDPPYTRNGIMVFLNRAIALLGRTTTYEGKYIFLYYGNSFKTPEKALKVQEVISNFDLVIEDKISNFAQYQGAESIGSNSSLYVLKTTKSTHPVDITSLTSSMYTYERQASEKFPFVDHYVFKLYDVPRQVISSKGALAKALGQFCVLHDLHVVDQKVTRFKKGGITFTFVLSNSNLVVHTWPEYQALHFDLITCSPVVKKDMLVFSLRKLFRTNRVEVKKIE